MRITSSSAYTVFQATVFDENFGTAVMRGSKKVWEREGKKIVVCNKSFCRHARNY